MCLLSAIVVDHHAQVNTCLPSVIGVDRHGQINSFFSLPLIVHHHAQVNTCLPSAIVTGLHAQVNTATCRLYAVVVARQAPVRPPLPSVQLLLPRDGPPLPAAEQVCWAWHPPPLCSLPPDMCHQHGNFPDAQLLVPVHRVQHLRRRFEGHNGGHLQLLRLCVDDVTWKRCQPGLGHWHVADTGVDDL